jgi:hypothetical protein
MIGLRADMGVWPVIIRGSSSDSATLGEIVFSDENTPEGLFFVVPLGKQLHQDEAEYILPSH